MQHSLLILLKDRTRQDWYNAPTTPLNVVYQVYQVHLQLLLTQTNVSVQTFHACTNLPGYWISPVNMCAISSYPMDYPRQLHLWTELIYILLCFYFLLLLVLLVAPSA